MAYIITDSCIKDGACVEACPVDCIHPHLDTAEAGSVAQLYINPVECIDCGACLPVCPSPGTIFPESELPEEKQPFVQINAAYFGQ